MIEPDQTDSREESEQPAQRPSKSERKRQSSALRDLGGELLQLPQEQLDSMALPNDLFEALALARTMKRDGAFKRQIKYIGKLLRKIDHAPIEVKLAEITQVSASATRALHRIEDWRDRLIAEGGPALDELLAAFPQADRPRVRRLVEAARREKERAQPPTSSRLLFKYLRELLESAEPPHEDVG